MEDPEPISDTVRRVQAALERVRTFEGESVAGLAAPPVNEVTDESVEAQLGKQRITQARQANKLRKRFYRWVAKIVTTTVVAGTLVIGAYIVSQWHHLDPAVLIAWFSAEIVQTVGLAYIVAAYLFPRPPRSATSEPTRRLR